MIGWWRTASIRVRLTVWYTAVLSLMLAGYAAATFLAVRHEFEEQLEDHMRSVPASGRDAQDDAEADMRRQLDEVLLVLIVGLPIVAGVAGVGGYVLARRALAPIDHLALEAHRITADRLHERLSVPNQQDEIGRLAGVINGTFARLEASFEQLRRFTADASHELRTPLSVIRGTGEIALRETRTPAEYKDTIGSMLEEVDRLTRLVETLLRLSRGETGAIRLERQPVDVTQLARDVAASLSVLAEERRQRLTVRGPSDVRVSADPLVLREAVTNVVDNAIKYSPPGSAIEVHVECGADVTIAVTDEGPGIADQHRERVFDRFYRIDEGRSREMGGTGLGLAIAKWAVEAHGGAIAVDPSRGGAVFRITLPGSTP